ncbi:MAG: hypothetical protein WC300_02970 [Candidatus Omnitrophota bacterium]|jgi:single-stranded-DNA-specific exonuclease
MIKKTWNIIRQDAILQKALTGCMRISPLVAQMLINRGIKTPREAELFLNPSLLNLHDPMLMKGMDKCVFRIRQAVQGGKRYLYMVIMMLMGSLPLP